MAQLIFGIKNLVGFERDLLHVMFVSQQWQWQSSEDYPSCVLYSINIKMVGHVANLVSYTLMSISLCAILG